MKTLNEILISQQLKPYFEKATQLIELNKLWQIYMTEWAEHCMVASYQHGLLILHVTNSAWATRIRFAIPHMLQRLSGHPVFKNLTIIKCRLAIAEGEKKATVPKTREPSAKAHTIIAEAAENIQNPSLKASLARLAKSMQKPSTRQE